MKSIEYENLIIKIILALGLLCSGAFLFYSGYRLMDNQGVIQQLRWDLVELRFAGKIYDQPTLPVNLLKEKFNPVAAHAFVESNTQGRFLGLLTETKPGVSATAHFSSDDRIEAEEGIYYAPFSVSLQGTYPDIVEYLGRLESSPFYVFLDEFTFERSVQVEEGQVITSLIKGHVYWR